MRGTRTAGIDDEEFRTPAQPSQDVMKENRMGLAGVGAPQNNDIGFFHFAVGTCAASRSENRRQTGDAGGMSSPVATVDVVAPDDGADEFLRDVVQLVRGFGTTEHAEGERAAALDLGANSRRNAIQSFLPGRGAVRSVFAD